MNALFSYDRYWLILFISGCVFGATPQRGISEEQADDAKAPKLSYAEAHFVANIEKQLVTKLQSKDKNPADSHTWYALVFRDSASSTVRSTSATHQNGVLTWSNGKSRQKRSAGDKAIVQGRRDAALTVARYLTSPNAAVQQLKPGSSKAQPGWMKKSDQEINATRQWFFGAFATESEARAFLKKLEEK